MNKIPEGLNYLSDASIYVDAIRDAKTHESLLSAVAQWKDIFPDAWEQANAIENWAEFDDYNQRLARMSYRQKAMIAKVEALTLKYGAVLLPNRMMQAQILAETFGAPWGCALIRLLEVEPK